MRLLYRFLYWFGQSNRESDIVYGYYRKFRRPEAVPSSELRGEIDRLGNAIIQASD